MTRSTRVIVLVGIRAILLTSAVPALLIGYVDHHPWLAWMACAAIAVHSAWNPLTLELIRRTAENNMENRDAERS